LASFGLVGLFIGPVILAILLAIWREWLHETTESGILMPDATMAYEIEENDPKKPD
jgi:predicted PurR-regulated permease PerM